jgi:hypothetical protein
MGRIIGYQYDDNVQDGDAWIGSEDGGGKTKQYTAQAVANYLNIQGKISIVGQMTYKYGITPLSGLGTFAVFGGGTDPVAFSAITKLTLSNTDVSKQRVVEFLNLLVGSGILISRQGAISTFGYYSIDNYAVNATDPAYYDLGVTFKSGNGSMEAEQIYETQNFTLAAEENISTLQTTIDAGNRYTSGSSLWRWDPGKISQVDPGEGWGLVLSPEEGVIFTNGVGGSAGRSHLQATNLRIGNLTYTGSVFATNLTADRDFQLPNNSGTLALTTDITASPWDTVTGGINYANGNVGIGTTSPSEKLDVEGNAAISGDITANRIYLDPNNTGGFQIGKTISTYSTDNSTSGMYAGSWNQIDVSPSASSGAFCSAAVNMAKQDGSHAGGTLKGSESYSIFQGSNGLNGGLFGSVNFASYRGIDPNNNNGSGTSVQAFYAKADTRTGATGDVNYLIGASVNTEINGASTQYLEGVRVSLKLNAGDVTNTVTGLLLRSGGTGANISGDLEYLKIQNDTLPAVGGTARAINSLSVLPSTFAGAIGIGTTTLPTNTLEVDGTASISGNVGIGTTSPVAMLEISKNQDGTGLTITQQNPGNGYHSKITFRGSDGSGGFLQTAGISAYQQTNGASGYLRLFAGTIEGLQIKAGGSIQLPTYGAGTLVTDASGNITVSSGGINDLTEYYDELIYVNGLLTTIETYEDNSKAVKLFTKSLTYSVGVLTQISLLNISTNITETKTLSYDIDGNLINITKS